MHALTFLKKYFLMEGIELFCLAILIISNNYLMFSNKSSLGEINVWGKGKKGGAKLGTKASVWLLSWKYLINPKSEADNQSHLLSA